MKTDQNIKDILGTSPKERMKRFLLFIGATSFLMVLIFLIMYVNYQKPSYDQSTSLSFLCGATALILAVITGISILAIPFELMNGFFKKQKKHDTMKSRLESREITPSFYLPSKGLATDESLIFDKNSNTIWINSYRWPLKNLIRVRYRGTLIDLHFNIGEHPIQSVRTKEHIEARRFKQTIMNFMGWS